MQVQAAQVDPRRWWALVALSFGLFMALLDVTIVNVALPSIQVALKAPFASLQWVINAYALVYAVALVTAARMGDHFGRKRVFMLGEAIFAIGSMLCALSGHISFLGLDHSAVLDIFRGLEGLGAAAMMPLSLALISTTFHGRERGAAIGIWGGVAGFASAVGPLVGGILVQAVGWESIFYLNVPIAILGIALCSWAVRESRDDSAPARVDFVGVVTITIALLTLVLALMQVNDADRGWTSPYILGLFALSAVFFVAHVLAELRIAHPMQDPRLFRIPGYTAANITAFVLSASTFSLFFFLSLYLQNTVGFSALGTGLRFLPLSALALLTAPLAGRFVHRTGEKPLILTALVLLTASAFLMLLGGMSRSPDVWLAMLPAFIAGGLGIGLVNPPMSSLAVGSVPYHRIGMASGVNSAARLMGQAFGIALFGAILSQRYAAAIKSGVDALKAPYLTPAIRTAIIKGVDSAGVVAGSAGLPSAGSPNPYAGNPLLPQIQAIAYHAYILGTRETFVVAGAMLAAAFLLTALLIRPGAMRHEGPAPKGAWEKVDAR